MLDPGDAATIYVDRQFAVVPLVSAGTESRTLAAPTKAGIFVMLVHDTDGGSVAVTITGGYNKLGYTIAIAYDAGDYLLLHSIKVGATYRWQVVACNGFIGPAEEALVMTGNGYYTGTSLMEMWEYCPSPADPRYDSLVHQYFNDFRALAADYDVTNEWTLTEDDAACTQALSADAVCGELLLTNKATTDDNGQQINLQQESFKLVSGKKLWFEARFKTAAGATQIDWAVGLIEAEDITGVADNMPDNGIVFKKDDGDTNIDIAACDGGTNTEGAALGTWNTSYHILGFYWNGGATGAGTITPYIDGTAGTAITGITYATMAELAPVFMVRNGDATTTQTMTVDYVKVVQMR
jgi:hypothetical protein